MNITISAQFISGGCNPVYGCLDQFQNTVIYGCHNQIFLYDLLTTQVKVALVSHKKRVNQCKFVPLQQQQNNDNPFSIISSSSEGLINIWQNPSKDIYSYADWTVKFKADLKGSSLFLALCPIIQQQQNQQQLLENPHLVLSGDTEGHVKLFKLTTSSFSEIDHLTFGNHNIIESADLQQINEKQVVIALGSLDFFIHIYLLNIEEALLQQQPQQQQNNDSQNHRKLLMQYRLTLKGHENSIMDLKFKKFFDSTIKNHYFLLASASRDAYIRLWKVEPIKQNELQQYQQNANQAQSSSQTTTKQLNSKEEKLNSIFDQKQTYAINDQFQVSLESVLKGHQDAVVSLCWGSICKTQENQKKNEFFQIQEQNKEGEDQRKNDSKDQEQNAALLSASSDCSLFIWSKDSSADFWMNKTRLGQISGSKYSFFNAIFAQNSSLVLSNTLNGAFYAWHRAEDGQFKLQPSVTGHFSYVNDLDWSSNCEFLASCSSDQTTRIFAQKRGITHTLQQKQQQLQQQQQEQEKQKEKEKENEDNNSLVQQQQNQQQTSLTQQQQKQFFLWSEIARAQIHGYDINTVKLMKVNCPFKQQQKDYQCCDILICGADEKILRLYEPSAIFVNYINTLSQTSLHLYFPTQEEENKYLMQLPQQSAISNQQSSSQANKPSSTITNVRYLTEAEGGQQVLGLMTKQVKVEREKVTTYYDAEESGAIATGEGEDCDILAEQSDLAQQQQQQQKFDENYQVPPHEEYLVRHTLWPELNKMYGHGYEISAVACNHQGTLIASACKSQTKESSCILFWNPKNYLMLYKLVFHNYSVMQLEFSHNDEFLGSVSRDRQFALFVRRRKNKPEEQQQQQQQQQQSENTTNGSSAQQQQQSPVQDFSEPNSNLLEYQYELVFSDSSHARIVWSLSFSHDDVLVITGSRDKKVKLWEITSQQQQQKDKEQSFSVQKVLESAINKNSVTAVAFADKFVIQQNKLKQKSEDSQKQQVQLAQDSCLYIVAVGFEDGQIIIFSLQKIAVNNNYKMDQIAKIHSNIGHSEVVRRIKFKNNNNNNNGENQFEFASCSDDFSVRIFEFTYQYQQQ